ncbi:hypothetical protein FisN_24Lh140 [Fistulifera solaris]|uniref:Uncharacterized protein n=1 Tax=Fistulifera solaris TaxID=1519565 RepID=A0A1Z5K9M7_FISSO|nr:hypothetical protein FisN_24Lh140 [Fistulifera solaris]|eukprot:GAX22855.1 hypothetical protein FisN_24Lh140 [Fistulifera solaris]
MNRSFRKTFRKKPKAKAPVWEEALANLNALLQKHPSEEEKMNGLVSALIELQQEYRASVAHCERLQHKVAELKREVEQKDQLLQERSLQIEAAHFRISGLTYLERTERVVVENEEEEKKPDEEEHLNDDNRHRKDKKIGRRPEVEDKIIREDRVRNDPSNPAVRKMEECWKPAYFGNPAEQNNQTMGCSHSPPSSVQDMGHAIDMVETLEI